MVVDHKDFVLQTLQELGWNINWEKSSLQPSTKCDFIGYVVHSCGKNGPWIQVMQKKLYKLRRHINKALSSQLVTARFLVKIAGECMAMMKAVIPAKLLLRNVYHILSSRSSGDSQLQSDKSCRNDLQWGFDALKNCNGTLLSTRKPQIQVMTDASKIGWGSWTSDLEASGTWNKEVAFKSSNFRELLVIYKSVQSFRNIFRNKKVQVLTDNVTAAAYINRLGGLSRELLQLMTSLFVVCDELNVDISAKFLAGVQNGHADRLSRILSPTNGSYIQACSVNWIACGDHTQWTVSHLS